MSVTFHESRTSREPIALLRDHEVATLNAAVEKYGLAFSLDPYGDTKLLDVHIERVVSLPNNAIDSNTRRVFENLIGREVVYVQGD